MQVNAIPLPGEGVVLLCPSSTTLPVSKGERKDRFAFTSGLHAIFVKIAPLTGGGQI